MSFHDAASEHKHKEVKFHLVCTFCCFLWLQSIFLQEFHCVWCTWPQESLRSITYYSIWVWYMQGRSDPQYILPVSKTVELYWVKYSFLFFCFFLPCPPSFSPTYLLQTNATGHPDAQEEEGGQGLPCQDQHHGCRARVQLGLQGDLANCWFSFCSCSIFFQATGQELFDLVCRTIGLRETW